MKVSGLTSTRSRPRYRPWTIAEASRVRPRPDQPARSASRSRTIQPMLWRVFSYWAPGIPQADDDLHRAPAWPPRPRATRKISPDPTRRACADGIRSRLGRIRGRPPASAGASAAAAPIRPAAAGVSIRGVVRNAVGMAVVAGQRRQNPPLDGAHRGLLDGLGVVPAADVERAVDRQQEQLLDRRPRTSPVCPPRPSAAWAMARSTETMMSPRWARRPGGRAKACLSAAATQGRAAGGRPLVGRERLGRKERERQHVGRARGAHVHGVQLGQLAVARENDADRARARSPGGLQGRPDRGRQAIPGDDMRHARPDRDVDPERREVDRGGGAFGPFRGFCHRGGLGRRGRSAVSTIAAVIPGSSVAPDSPGRRIVAVPLVGVIDRRSASPAAPVGPMIPSSAIPGRVHGATRSRRPCSAGRRCAGGTCPELADEGFADLLEVANREVALVELAVAQSLLDDLADHGPYCGLVAARE